MNNEINNNESLDCYFAIRDYLESKRTYYLANYKVTPSIKASIHIGDSVKCCVSNEKFNETYLGLSINITSRILWVFSTIKKEVLTSEDISLLCNQ